MEHSLSWIETIALETLATVPAPFRTAASTIVLRVEEVPGPETLRGLDLTDPLDLTGLYDGIPLTEASVVDPSPYPARITLFRQPILAELSERPDVTLEELVAHVVIHELAHHFGWSDEDIATVDQWWE